MNFVGIEIAFRLLRNTGL